jgi:hypothetical protein
VADVRDIGVKCLHIAADVASTPGNGSLFRIHQSTQGAQQAGLAGAIAAGDLQAFARIDRESHAAQDVSVTPPQVQILGLQAALGHGAAQRGGTMARESRKFSGLAP